MSLLLSRYCTLLLPELQASEDSHSAFILRTWSCMSVLSIRFRYYMSAHEGPSSYSKSRIFDQVCGNGKLNLVKTPFSGRADNTDMHKLRPGARSGTAFLLGCALCNVAFA